MRIFFTVTGALTLLTSIVGVVLYSPPGSGLYAGIEILRRHTGDSKTWIITASERFMWLAFAGAGLRIFESNVTRLDRPIIFLNWFDEATIVSTIIFSALASCWRLGAYLYYRKWPMQ